MFLPNLARICRFLPLLPCLLLEACARPVATATPAALDTPPACLQAGQSWVSPLDGMELVCVPAGEFWMGAAEGDLAADPDERPRHRVSLDAYWIDRSEVTNAMFAGCVAARACHAREYSPYLWGVRLPNGTPYYGESDYSDYPVIMLDSDEADAYCRWAGRRLPSEAEWEKAARNPQGGLYPWEGDLDCAHANFLGCEKHPLGVTALALGASSYGAQHMAGNLWEWVADWYDPAYYSISPASNPPGPLNGEYRTLRGGGWNSISLDLRVSNRSTGKPEHTTDGAIGIRCALGATSP